MVPLFVMNMLHFSRKDLYFLQDPQTNFTLKFQSLGHPIQGFPHAKASLIAVTN